MKWRNTLCLILTASLGFGGGGVSSGLAAPTGQVEISVGQAAVFSHIEFRGREPRSVRREGRDLVLNFGPILLPDVAALRGAPPKFLKSVNADQTPGGVELRLGLAEKTEVTVGRADGATYVNLAEAPEVEPPPPDQKPEERVNPVPPTGEIAMHAEMQGGALLLHFPWRAPLGAAAFRRGDAIWVVFDAKAHVDLSEAPHGLPQAGRMVQAPADNATAIRITAPPSVLASLTAQGAVWTLSLGPIAGDPPTAVTLKPDLTATPAALTGQIAGATGVFWINDPMVGDRLAVVTALGPAKGVIAPRTLVDADILASVQGVVVAPHVSDLKVSTDGDIVRIGRPQGLALSPASSETRRAGAGDAALPARASMPALVDFDGWSKLGPGGFLARYNQLNAAVADEINKGKSAGVQARLGLARFLVGSELGYEAIGVLNGLIKANPLMLQDPEVRGLRGAARAMVGRFKDAEADFSSPVVAEDPASSLWRAYISNHLGDVAGARQQYGAGRSALAMFNPKWRARFSCADAEASIAAGDLGTAQRDLLYVTTDGLEPYEQQMVLLDRARLLEVSGQPAKALGLYQQVAAGPFGGLSAPAMLHVTEIQLALGRQKPNDAVQVLDSLRFRWRGDNTELETVRALARIYMGEGQYREALDALRSASRSLSHLPAVAEIQNDLSAAFQGLFLKGGANGLPPIQAMGLFLDYKDLTPIGADGDLMVRRLAGRLVDVDLLDQAATLLKYQADNRLDGLARAEVDTDLAMIELMNRAPEAALDAINSSRSTLLPKDLAARRRLLQARALSGLGRYDDALELLAKDPSPDAADTRAEIAWKQRDWAKAGAILEAELGDRWRSATPLDQLDQGHLLRAAVAFSLANDDAALARLRARYGKLADGAANPNALKVALAGVQTGPYTAADYVRAVSDSDTFTGWVAAMKAKYLKETGKG
jgi:tetratricopeptide (TPR) repeat protein